MTFSDYADLTKIGLLAVACLISIQAVFIIAAHAANEAIFYLSGHDPVVYYCAAATMYALASTANVKMLDQIRFALLAIAIINWIAAIDFMLSPFQTMYGMCYPWLINGFDVLILYLLFRHKDKDCGGRLSGTFSSYMGASSAIIHNFNLRVARLYLLQRFKTQDPE